MWLQGSPPHWQGTVFPICRFNISTTSDRCRALLLPGRLFSRGQVSADVCPLPLWGPKGGNGHRWATHSSTGHPAWTRIEGTHRGWRLLGEYQPCTHKPAEPSFPWLLRSHPFPEAFLSVAQSWPVISTTRSLGHILSYQTGKVLSGTWTDRCLQFSQDTDLLSK